VKHRFLATVAGALGIALAVAWLGQTPTAGQGQAPAEGQAGAKSDWKSTRLPWGDPDLQGMWDTRTFAPVERPEAFGMREFMTEEEAAKRNALGLTRVQSGDEDETGDDLKEQDVKRYAASDRPDDGRPGYRIAGAEYNAFWSADPTQPKVSLRTSQVVDPPDGKVPPLTREALELWEARDKARLGRSQADDWEDRGLSERCIVRNGLPGEMRGDTQQPLKQVVQSPGYVSIVMPYGYVRTIPVGPAGQKPKVGKGIRQWNGDPRGRWEGDTLVVTTTNFKETVKNVVPGHGGPFGGSDHVHYYPAPGDTLTLTERFTRTDKETIEYRYTVDDPKAFVRPWTTVVYWNLDAWTEQGKQDRLFEYACHEHNYGIVNALRGSRVNRTEAMDEAAREVNVRKRERNAKWEALKKWEAANPKK
jgi:hypothetical protein